MHCLEMYFVGAVPQGTATRLTTAAVISANFYAVHTIYLITSERFVHGISAAVFYHLLYHVQWS